jgi:hypothetical protein
MAEAPKGVVISVNPDNVIGLEEFPERRLSLLRKPFTSNDVALKIRQLLS